VGCSSKGSVSRRETPRLRTRKANQSRADLLVQRIRQIGTNRLLYGSDAATADNEPKDTLKRWHSLPLTQEEFREIDNNVARYLRNWLSAAESRR
jgi:hypothetical protein